MDEVTITKLINGPEAFTPDNEFCLGESEVRGFFVADGFCAHGLAGAGGIGRVIAEWIAEGEPASTSGRWTCGASAPSIARRPTPTRAPVKTYETYYDIRYPNHEREAGRPLRVSAANAWHADHGAAFGEKSGWERVNCNRTSRTPPPATSRCARGCWAGRHWSPRSAPNTGRRATRWPIFDESSFAKMEIEGPGAAALLEGLCDNRVARAEGQITYTQMLNRRGGIECDFTVARLRPRSCSRSSPARRSETTTASGSKARLRRTARRRSAT